MGKHCVFVVLNESERLDDLLRAWHDAGAAGATVFDSHGMGRAMHQPHQRLFPSIAAVVGSWEGARPHNVTAFTIVEDDATRDRVIQATQELTGGLERPGTGILFTVPVGVVIGLYSPKA